MAVWFRALDAFSDGLGFIPSTHMVIAVLCNSSPKVPVLFWPLRMLGMHVVHRHNTHVYTHSYA